MTGSNQVSNVVSSVVTPVALSGVKTPLLNQFEGAAAAYSLRRLKSWDDGSRVVRVRRESDNTERDFSSVEVSDGTMARWVNEQPTLPLDLRELDTNTGERDGALIEAAAAYSLRKLKKDFTGDVVEVRRNVDGETEGFTADEVTDGTLENFVNASFDDELPLDQATGAAAAYSLRSLSSSFTGNVVEVRRSSDDAVQSFTASEVADGTLEDWVTASFDVVTPTLNNGGFETAGTGGFDYWTENVSGSSTITRDTSEFYSGTASCRLDVDSSNSFTGIRTPVSGGIFNVGTTLTYSIRAKGTSGSKLLIGTAGNDARNDTLDLTTEWQEYTGTVNPHDADTNVQIKRLDSANATIWIDEVTFTINGKDGYVRTWYDQSGSGNNAVQTDPTKQPKIVEGGVLVTRNGDAAIKSTSDNEMTFTLDSLSADGQQSVFGVLENDVTSQDGFGSALRVFSTSTSAGGVNRRPWWLTDPSGNIYFSVDSTAGYLNSDREYRLYSHIMNDAAGGTSTVHRDGTQVDTRSITLDANTTFSSGGVLGVTTNATGALYMSEVIYYPSDQSDKRRAIEENIANHYDISLAAFSRDGTVSTWYDQSGNTNDATQTDPAKQPKIVIDGDLVTGGIDFNGAEFLSRSSFTQGDLEQPNTTFSVAKLDSNDDTNRKVYDGETGNGRNMLFLSQQDSGQFGIYSGSTLLTGDLATSDKHLFTALYNSTSSEFFIDGTSEASGDAGVYSMDAIVIGANHDEASNFWLGQIQEIIIYNSDQTDNRTAIEANIGETYGITAIPAANDTVNGYVQTWYDQSGNGNDAEQSAASSQPKIVDSGTLIKRNNNPAIESTSDDSLSFTLDALSADGQQSAFAVLENEVTAQDGFGNVFRVSSDTGSVTNRRPYWFVNPTGGLAFTVDSASGYQNTDREYRLYSHIMNDDAGGTSTVHRDGTQVDTRAITLDTNTTFQGAKLAGVTSNATGSLYMSEVIYYPSDQSSNRPAIETNIANQYGITLS